MIIYGAGMAGLVAAHMLRRFQPEVREAQDRLPENHAALLRFRTDACSVATGIPFDRVRVSKAVAYNGRLHSVATLAMNNRYAAKVVGRVTNRSALNTVDSERFIAPADFVAQLASSVRVQFGSRLGAEVMARDENSPPLISTIPMPAMAELVGYKELPTLLRRPVWSVRAQLKDCDVYQTVYYPDETVPWYRASITGATLIVECLEEPDAFALPKQLASVLHDFGINQAVHSPVVKKQAYGKISTPDPEGCRRFVLWLTDRYRIYSLGRFATWRQLLLDDVVSDVRVIERLADYRGGYKQELEKAR